MANVSIYMLRDTREPAPQFPLPAGYRFRPYADGDEATWVRIQQRAETFLKITPEVFRKNFAYAPEELPRRMFFVQTVPAQGPGEDIATISAWWNDRWHDGRTWGRIHWVAVDPAHQGKKLSKPMMTHAMNVLLARHERVMLATSTGRMYAIKVYLDFGFIPLPDELARPEVLAAWRELQATLNHPLLKNLPG